jgi:signal transduction histidine kinase
LGDKQDGGLYTQEEIEIARASGERLIDTQATAHVSRRLMALLRQRIAQVKVMEGQGRRVLHDEVLPQLHTAILGLGGAASEPVVQDAVSVLTMVHRRISDLMRDTASQTPHALAQVGLIDALRESVADEFSDAIDEISWRISAESTEVADGLPSHVRQVVYFAALELIRNVARHGRGTDLARPLHLWVAFERIDGLRLSIEDDGVGLSMAASETAGGRNGLQFHGTMLAAVGGSLEVGDARGRGTRAVIVIPAELSAAH